MTNALIRAQSRNRNVLKQAYDRAMSMKNSGVLDAVSAGESGGGFGMMQSQGKTRLHYAMNRGWLYSAIDALASEAAGQAVNLGRLKGGTPNEEDARGRISQIKEYQKSAMTKGMRSKATGQELEIVLDHPLLDVLERPNHIQGRWQFVNSFVSNLNLTGWSYVVGGMNPEGRLEMWSLPTTWITASSDFTKFRIDDPKNPSLNASEADFIGRENIAFAYLPDPSDPKSALSPVTTQLPAIRIDEQIQTSQERFFENGVFPSVVISIGKNPHPEVPGGLRPRLSGHQRRQITTAIKKMSSSSANYGNPAIIDGMIESITPISLSSQEMGWEKSELSARRRILSAFGVHPFILGEEFAGSYAQAYKIEDRFCKRVNAFLDMLSSMLTSFLGPLAEPESKLIIWWDKCTAIDPSIESNEWKEGRKNNDVSRNEYRARLGLPPAEEKQERNKLLESVGGLSGALNMVSQVGQGIIPREAAVQLFSLFFEIPEEVAAAVIGERSDEQLVDETVEVVRDLIAEMKTPMKIDLADAEFKLALEAVSRAAESSTRSAIESKSDNEVLKSTVSRLREETRETRQVANTAASSAVDKVKQITDDAKKDIFQLVAELEKSLSKGDASAERTNQLVTSIAKMQKAVSDSLDTVNESVKKPIALNITNDIQPTPIEITNEVQTPEVNVQVDNEVKTPEVNVAVENKVDPTPIKITNEVQTPEVNVMNDLKAPEVNIAVGSPTVEVTPTIEIKTPPAQVEVKINKEDTPTRATIIHPNQQVSQIELHKDGDE